MVLNHVAKHLLHSLLSFHAKFGENLKTVFTARRYA